MQRRHLCFSIRDNVAIDLDFARRTASLRLETEEGKPLRLEAKYETWEKIHQAIEEKLNAR